MNAKILRPFVVAATFGVCAAKAVPASASRETVLYSFCQTSGCPDGRSPYAPMVQDARGNLYGTTEAGGNSHNAGTIFELEKVKRNWVFHSLYSFCAQANCTDGDIPVGGLILDTSGNLYGTTGDGGNANAGTVYELQKNGKLKVLYSFCVEQYCPDGSFPGAGLTYQGQQSGQLYDGKSMLYGSTNLGGPKNWGVVYTIVPGKAESVLYGFGAKHNEYDGAEPQDVILDGAGNVYGTTFGGGSETSGTIFGISPSGSETLLFSFCSQQGEDCDGLPGGGLLMEPDGALLGTTTLEAVIYRFAAGTYATLASFCRSRQCRRGSDPNGALIPDAAGMLYGVASAGGRSPDDGGTVFEFTGSKLKTLYLFCAKTNCADGAEPFGTPVINNSGQLFGTTAAGGAYNGGTIFELL